MEVGAYQFIESYTCSSICIPIPEDTMNTGGEKQMEIFTLHILRIFFSQLQNGVKIRKKNFIYKKF